MTAPEQQIEEVRERVATLAAEGDLAQIGRRAAELHPSDLADLVEALDEARRIALISALPLELASETLAEMEEGPVRAQLLAALHPARSAELLHELADDDAADLIGELDSAERQRILAALPHEEAGELRGLLRYHEESAGGLMTTDLVAVRVSLTAREALEQVRAKGREVEDFYTVFVVDPQSRLLGTLRLDDLVIAEPDEPIEGLVEAPIVTVLPDMDQEEVGRIIGRYNLVSLPVVDGDGRLLGRITFDDVIDVIEMEQTEDILLMAGVGSDQGALRYTWGESVRARIPWLFVNLATAAIAATVVYVYSDTIENVVILAAIMPIVAGLGGNAGTQALAVTVRSIALAGGPGRGREIWLTVGRELSVGLINGAILGTLVAGVAVAVGGDAKLGVVVLLAMWGNLIIAGFLGSFVPTVLSRLGVDPAVGSSMFVTPFTDFFGFLILLGLATSILL